MQTGWYSNEKQTFTVRIKVILHYTINKAKVYCDWFIALVNGNTHNAHI